MQRIPLKFPRLLVQTCATSPERVAWLERLPDVIDELRNRWHLSLDDPYDHDDAMCAWVAPATRADGTLAVLKLGMPHMEGEDELRGLRHWAGDGMVRLLDADESLDAMLLERCVPGTSLKHVPEP